MNTPALRYLSRRVVACAIAGCAVLGLAALAPAATPAAPEIIPVWGDPTEDGAMYYHIPQILVTRSGAIVACAESRHARGDGVKVDIVLRRSLDGGRTWTKSHMIERTVGNENYVLPSLIQERRTGRIFFFCALRNEGLRDATTENFYRYSDDDGVTWSDRVDVTSVLLAAERNLVAALREGRAGPAFAGGPEELALYDRSLFFSGPGRPIQLSAGHPSHPHRLVIPIFVIKDRVKRNGYGNAVLVSDDAGVTWQVPGITPIGDISASEPSIVELADGRLLFNSRETPKQNFLAAPARRTLSYSSDGGATWTRPIADDSGIPTYYETHSGLFRLSDPRTDPAKVSRILFSFPAGPKSAGDGSAKRSNGTLFLSYDEHRSWPVKKLLIPDKYSYSNIDLLPDGTIVVLFNGPGPLDGHIHLARFSLEWLTDGKDSFATGPKAP